MPQRRYSVVIVPRRWNGSLDELARLLVPVTRQSADRLARTLERGMVTLDADLRREEADMLLKRLERMELPAEIHDDEGEPVDRVGPEPAAIEGEASTPDAEPPAGEADVSALDDESFTAALEEALAEEDEEAAWDSVLREVSSEVESEEAAELEPEPEPEPPADESLDVEVAPGDQETPSLDELAGDSQPVVSRPGPTPDPEPEHEPEDDTDGEAPGDSAESTTPAAGASSPADLFEEAVSAVEERAEGEDAAGSAPADGATSPVQPPSSGPPDASNDPLQPPSSGPPDSSPEPPDVSSPSGGFDAGRMDQALNDTNDEQHRQTGYDDRPEHIPALAALLNLVAPGAGRIYNGDVDGGWALAVRAPLIVPWIRSVGEAFREGEAIRRGDRPKPPRGTFRQAMSHVGILYAGLAGLVVGVVLVGRLAYEMAGPEEPEPKVDPSARVAAAVDEAELVVHGARIDGWQRAGEQRVPDDERFTMSRKERAARLFRIGYGHCRARKYDLCQSAMRRVSSLSDKYRRDAFRLQAWAGVQSNPGESKEPMPEVRETETLEEYENRPRDAAGGDGSAGPDAGSPGDAEVANRPDGSTVPDDVTRDD